MQVPLMISCGRKSTQSRATPATYILAFDEMGKCDCHGAGQQWMRKGPMMWRVRSGMRICVCTAEHPFSEKTWFPMHFSWRRSAGEEGVNNVKGAPWNQDVFVHSRRSLFKKASCPRKPCDSCQKACLPTGMKQAHLPDPEDKCNVAGEQWGGRG